jgi:hypothetical protein
MEHNSNVLTRHCAPSRFDSEPRGTIIEVLGDEHRSLYVQVGKDSTEWIRVGEWLEKALETNIYNENFIENTMRSYDKNSALTFKKD